MGAWQEDAGLKWRELAPFGVEIDHDFSAPLSAQEAEQFIFLFNEFGLISAHGQTLSRERQTDILKLVGPILLRKGEDGFISTENGNRSELSFHADAAYTEHPFDALSLHALEVVDGASSTRFAGAARAFAAMPAALRDKYVAQQVEMISPSFDMVGRRMCDVRDPVFTRRNTMPSVMVNPRSGRPSIGVSEMHTAKIAGMEWEESRDFLNAVFEYLYAPENIYEHFWRNGDIVIWDNYSFQHARGALHSAGTRILQRVLVGVEGEVPYAMGTATTG